MTLLTMHLIEEYKTLEEAAEAAWFEANGGGWNASAFKEAAKELDVLLGNDVQEKEDYPVWIS